MMADSLTNAQFPTIRKAFMSVYNQGDPKTAWARIRNFYTGFLPCFLRAFPTNAAALFAFETTMRLMGAENVSSVVGCSEVRLLTARVGCAD